ncbi:MAG TPA: ATP-dependent DNA ligase [Vitreimonas sp.]|nr:ATP-dependent DNA ligase [Vitreimonas sp.]
MHFTAFAAHLEKLEATASRLSLAALLAELYQELQPAEIQPASYLLQGSLVAEYESLEFQLSDKMVIRALARLVATRGTTSSATQSDLFGESEVSDAEQQVAAWYKETGDLGLVALRLGEGNASEITLLDTYQRLQAIAQESGAGSQERKLQGLEDLLLQLDAIGRKVVVRIILGNLRLGFSTMTMLDALSWAVTGGKTENKMLETAYQKKADIGALAAAYLTAWREGADAAARATLLNEYSVAVGVPVLPALCQRLESAAEIIEKMGEVIAEPKYDGVRVQIHIIKKSAQSASSTIKTFTRSLEENSHQFPELWSIIDDLKCQSCILDAEAIGFDKATGKLLLFQDTITRKRKHGVEERASEIPLRFFVFDIIELDGRSLLDTPLQERKEALEKLFQDNETIQHTPYIVTEIPETLREFHEAQLAEGLEGAVIKQRYSGYQSGRKGWSWVKIKEAEGTTGKLRDTVDCIVMGYYVGRGKRAGFGLGAFLAGVLNEQGIVKTIAKVGTGLSDEQFVQLKQRTESLRSDEPPAVYDVAKALQPDVWLKPEVVVEIAADELTVSPNHTAGWALRFPRLVNFREDKTWAQATTIDEIKQLV